jgi:uncharacterized protein YebE (UPF0316 family)
LDWDLLATGLLVFVSRVGDVSIGTIRTIMTVQGRTAVSFCLAVIEISIWITVVSTVILKVQAQPFLVIFYAFGFATGNVIGILVERKLAFGIIILRVITRSRGIPMADRLRELGQQVTLFTGEGMRGPVNELYIACRRRDLKWILPIVKSEDPDAFYITEQARDVSRVLRPVATPVGGWRASLKKK